MTKFRLYFDKDAETKWLNDMAAKGWALKSFFAGFYNFEKCKEGEYIYQIDMGDKFYAVSDEYREFMEDTGVEIVQTWGFWIILRKKASDGEFELYTDVDSSIEHYTKIRNMFKGVAMIEIICLAIEVSAALAGNQLAYGFSFLIGALLLAIVNVTVKTNNVIDELKERKTGIATKKCPRNVSMLLPCGLLMNSCALMMDGSVSDYIKMTVQIIAIVLMLAGIYLTARKRK